MQPTDRPPAQRWAVAWAGVAVMLCIGTVYAWSNFTQPLLASFNWSNTTTTLTFELAIFFLGIGAVVGGRWQDRVGPRRVIQVGVVLWGSATSSRRSDRTCRGGGISPTA